jgi:hypothetical protein
MPDFDLNMNPYLVNKDIAIPDIPNFVSPIPNDYVGVGETNSRGKRLSEDNPLTDPLYREAFKPTEMAPTVTSKELYDNRRYGVYNRDTVNVEDQSANAQSGWEQAGRGILKGVNLTGTTILGGFGTLYGIGKFAFTHKLSDVYDNEPLRLLDAWNTKVDQEYLPNYYSDKETNAKWYETDNWMTANFLFDKVIKNSGYAAGAMISGNMAGGVLGAAGKAIGGLAMRGATAAESAQAFKVFTPLLRGTARAFSVGKNVEAAAVLENGLSTVANAEIRGAELFKIAKQSNKFIKMNDAGRRLGISTYSVAGESGFEALQNANSYREAKIQEFIDKNGYEPYGEELKAIDTQSSKVGNVSFIANMALLSLSQGIQLPHLMGSSYSASRKASLAMLRETEENILKQEGKYVAQSMLPKPKYVKLFNQVRKYSGYALSPIEGAEEIGQYAIGVGTNHYFNNKQSDNSVSDYLSSFVKEATYGLFDEKEGALNSKEGIEGGIIGMLTGGAMTAFTSTGKIAQDKRKAVNTTAFVDAINNAPSLSDAFVDKVKFTDRGVSAMKKYNDSVQAGDRLEAQDAKADLLHSYLAPRIKYGRLDMIKADLAELRQEANSPEMLAALKETGIGNINDTSQSLQKRISNIEAVAERTNEIAEHIHNVYFSETLKDAEGKEVLDPNGKSYLKYNEEALDKLGYATFKVSDYDVRIPQVNSELVSYGVSTSEILQNIKEKGKPSREVLDKALQNINELDVLSGTKDDLKSALTDVIELSMRRKLFMEEYDGIKKNPLLYESVSQEEDNSPVIVEQKDKSNTVDKELEIGKNYDLEDSLIEINGELVFNPKLTVVSKTLSGELEVQLPNGKTTFLTPTQFKEYKISEKEHLTKELGDILENSIDTVLKQEEFSELEIPEEGRLETINGLENQSLTQAIKKEYAKQSFELLETIRKETEKRARLASLKTAIDNSQSELEKTSGIPTSSNSSTWGTTESAKEASTIFSSSTSEKEQNDNNDFSEPHIKRARRFLNKFRFFPKLKSGEKYKAILVTPYNAKNLGLEGIVAQSYKQQVPENHNDVLMGFMAQVYIIQNSEGEFFIDENGKIISKVGETSSDLLDKIIYQTMPSSQLETSGGYTRVREGQEELAEQYLEAYKKWREQTYTNTNYSSYEFTVSRGLSNTVKIGDNYENFHVSGILGEEAERLIKEHTLLTVATTNTVAFNGENITVPVGTTLIKFGDSLDFVNNKQINVKQSKTIFELFKTIASELIEQSETKKAPSINYAYSHFLQNILYWKSKADTNSPSQVGIDTATMKLNIGAQSFSLHELEINKEPILNAIQEAYFNINNVTLTEGLSKTFTEYYLDKDNNIQSREWENYQSYLLSENFPNKEGKRSIEDTPIITHTRPQTDEINSFKQKYTTLKGLTLPISKTSSKTQKASKETVIPAIQKVGEYDVTGKENVFPVNGTEGVKFTATFSDDNNFNVIVLDSDAIDKYTNSENALKAIDAFFEANPSLKQFEETDTVAKVKLYFELAINSNLIKLNSQQTPIQESTQSKIDTKKAGKDKKIENISFTKNGFEGSFLDNYNYLSEGSESVVYISKDGTHVIKLSEPYNSKEEDLYNNRIEQTLLREIIGNSGLEVLGYYEYNGIKNPIYKQNYVKGDVLTEEEVKAHLRTINGILEIDEGFYYKHNDVLYKINDFTDNVIKDENGNIVPIDLDIFEITDNNIISKYTIQLSNPSNDKASEEKQSTNSEASQINNDAPIPKGFNLANKRKGLNTNNRVVGKDVTDRMSSRDLEDFKEWHAKNIPNVPFEVLVNLINTHDGRKAWGVFEKGVIKFVKGGLRGTEYHEAFEAIWADFLTEDQKQVILQQERNKSGEFTDRASGKKYAYVDPTVSDDMLKERIADDFSDYRIGKLPARTLGEAIRKFFKSIMDFFKSFVNKPTLAEELFKQIDKGRFSNSQLSDKAKNYPVQYRVEDIVGITETQANDFVEDMVASVKFIIFEDGNKAKLFNPEEITSKEIFNRLKEISEDNGTLEVLGEKRYNALVKRAVQRLRTYGVTLNEADISINDENVSHKEYETNPFSTDWKSFTPGAIKFALATLVEREQTNNGELIITDPDTSKSSVGGFKLIPYNKVMSTLIDRLHNTTNYVSFVNKLVKLAKEDANYIPVLKNLGLEQGMSGFANYTSLEDWRYFVQFYKLFTKQKPEALIQYIKDQEIYTNSANVYTIVNNTVEKWVNNMRKLSHEGTDVFSFDKKIKTYKVNTDEIKKIYIRNKQNQLDFLNKIGIDFSEQAYDKLTKDQIVVNGKLTSEIDMFAEAISSIRNYLGSNNDLMTMDSTKLDIRGSLRTLSNLQTKALNPSQDSTYFGVEGQRIGTYSENNAPSYFENVFNESETLEELLTAMPQLQDVFSKNSNILKLGGLFFDKTGKRIAELKVEYIQGVENNVTNKNKATSSLSEADRKVTEINQNLKGKYYVLIPADSSTEWMLTLGNPISFEEVLSGKHWDSLYSVFNKYLEDEINLALENRTTNRNTKNNAQSLRFLKDILDEKDTTQIENRIKAGMSFEDISNDYILKNKDSINQAIKSFIETKSLTTFNILTESQKIFSSGELFGLNESFDTEFLKKYKLDGMLSKEQVMDFINYLNINYAINNIELHKVLFGDPYQFKIKGGNLEETKRIKSFLSPRRRLVDMQEFNDFLNETYNKVGNTRLTPNDPGYHLHKSYTDTVTLSTVSVVSSIAMQEISEINKKSYSNVDETDAFSFIMDATHKEIAEKEGQWTKEAEEFHQWQMAYTRRAFDAKNILGYKYPNQELKAHDALLLLKESPKYKLAVRKPIVSGNKANKTNIDLVLDKTSQMPIYYSMVEGRSMEQFYIKMFNQKLGYAIFETGRKVGIEETNTLYNEQGELNTNDFFNVISVPWSSYGTQVETMSEGPKTQTRGSQPTKMASIDLYENGEPLSIEGQTAHERHEKALRALNVNAYNELLSKLGIEENDQEFTLTDGTKVSETLMYEMLRRHVSENVKDTLDLDEDGLFSIPLEASPSFIQIRNILQSLITKAVISPSVNGSPHVQVPSTMFEEATEGRELVLKTVKGYEKVSKKRYKSLSEEDKKKVYLTDSNLKIYENEDGKRYCEVLLPFWAKNLISKGKFKNDQELLSYLNSVDGGKMLEIIGFRIPTQALSSMEVIKVKGFLPSYMGTTVVVPSAITMKAGSDFDIDKLNMYLKSIYKDASGNLRLVTLKGSEKETKDFYTKVFNSDLENQQLDKLGLIEAVDILIYNLPDPNNLVSKHAKFIKSVQDEYPNPHEFKEEIEKQLETLTDENIQSVYREKYVNDMYKAALENEYFDSLREILTLEENYENLISPIGDGGLEKLSEELEKLRGTSENNIKGKLLDRNYMSSLRHSFITGKKWVGVVATNITGLSIRQKAKVYLDPSKLSFLTKEEKMFVQDLSIAISHNTVRIDGKDYVSLSGRKSVDGQLISERFSGYASAVVDIAANPFIAKIIKSNTSLSTFMFLEAIGAGENSIFFMNQPIIEKYLQYLENTGSQNVMNPKAIEYINTFFPTKDTDLLNVSINPNIDSFKSNIEDYYNDVSFSDTRNAEQQLILKEFIKYKILADKLFEYNQSLNYDTSRFSSSDLLYKKQLDTENVKQTSIISNVQDVLNNTFIGETANLLDKLQKSYGTIIKTDSEKIKAYILPTLKRYATKKYMSSEEFEKIANLIRNSFLDYVIQTNSNYTQLLAPLLLEGKDSIAFQLAQAKEQFPNNQLIQELQIAPSKRYQGATSIQLEVNVKDPITENMYVGMMRELRDDPDSNIFYNSLLNTAILQGSSQSAISIKNIIPVEDYSARLSNIFNQLVPSEALKSFDSMFERNNFLNNTVFVEHSPSTFATDMPIADQYGNITETYNVPSFVAIKVGSKKEILKVNESFYSREISSDYIKVPKIVGKENNKVNILTGTEVTKGDYKRMKEKGDYNLNDYFYFKKVYSSELDSQGNKLPFTTYNKKRESNDYYYKLINVYGDGNRAVEYNTTHTPSVFNNGSITTPQELTDDEIVNKFSALSKVTTPATIQNIKENVKEETEKIVINAEYLQSLPKLQYTKKFGNYDMHSSQLGDSLFNKSINLNDIFSTDKPFQYILTVNNLTAQSKYHPSTIEVAEYYVDTQQKVVSPLYLVKGSYVENLINQKDNTIYKLNNPNLLSQWSHQDKVPFNVTKVFYSVRKEEIIDKNKITKTSIIEQNDNNQNEEKYELFPGVYANKGQTEALNQLNNFLKEIKKEFLLQGKGGTGKTTIIKKILEKLPKQDVLVIAPTHKAKKVLEKSINKENEIKYKSATLASALAIKLDEETGKFTPDLFARENGKVPITFAKYIILDESSMVSDKLLEEIREWAPTNSKLILMGDKAQLPPVGQEKDSAVFDIDNGYELTEKMRQAATSPIINIGSKVAYNVETLDNNRVNNPIEKQDRINSYDSVSGSSIIWENNEEQAIKQFVKDFKQAPSNTNNVKIITFNNQNHNNSQSVKSLNNKVRKELYGERANSEQFIEGEIVTAYASWGNKGSDEDSIVIHNSEDFVVKSVENLKDKGQIYVTSRAKGTRGFDYEYNILSLELINEEGKPIIGSTVHIIAESSLKKYQEDLNSLWDSDKQLAFALQNKFANIQYGYAITSHKSQGSTYKNVYVMEDNIMGPSNGGSVKSKNQSLYVAVSRPSQKLVMVSTKNNSKQNNSFDDITEFTQERKSEILSNFEYNKTIEDLGITKEEWDSLDNEVKQAIIKCN